MQKSLQTMLQKFVFVLLKRLCC